MSLQLQVWIAIRVLSKIRSVNLRHNGQRGPPGLPAVTNHRPKEEGGVFPFAIFWQFIVITRFHANRPPLGDVVSKAAAYFYFAFRLVQVISPLSGMGQVQS